MLKGTKVNKIPKEERETLTCSDCEQDLPRDRFAKNGTGKTGKIRYNRRCKDCHKTYIRVRFGHPSTNSPAKCRRSLLITEAKMNCVMCGYDRSKKALEFHHIIPETKEFAISNALNRPGKYTDEMVKKEIEKCVVLCSNCHRELHDGLISLSERPY